MDKAIELLNDGVLFIAEKTFDLIDSLDFVHPIIIIALFSGILMSIYLFTPSWVAQTLLFLIFVPLMSVMFSIIYIGVATLSIKRDDYF